MGRAEVEGGLQRDRLAQRSVDVVTATQGNGPAGYKGDPRGGTERRRQLVLALKVAENLRHIFGHAGSHRIERGFRGENSTAVEHLVVHHQLIEQVVEIDDRVAAERAPIVEPLASG
jgi:hypothetical protein